MKFISNTLELRSSAKLKEKLPHIFPTNYLRNVGNFHSAEVCMYVLHSASTMYVKHDDKVHALSKFVGPF